LVVRITADGHLGDSKPCCMCNYLMKIYGIRKVYYSDADENICCQKLNQMDDDSGDHYFSHGLKLMSIYCSGSIIGKKIPLTREQKTYLISLSAEVK